METKITTPVLLIAFNRPDTTEQVFQKIREVQPKKLYVAIDGPRKNEVNEMKLVENVKQIVQKVDWECENHYMYNNENLGAEVTVSKAVSWALENNESVIILEDDIIAPKSFFKFAEEMLIRYKNNNQIAMISGMNTTPIQLKNNADYTFGIYGHIWGWATWKRSWDKFDLNINDFENYQHSNAIDHLVNNKKEKKYWHKIIRRMEKKGVGNSTWDYCWSYIRFKDQGLSIIPKTNLVTNIGVQGLHARGQSKFHFIPYDEDFIVNNHPLEIKRDIIYDNYHFKRHINRKSFIEKALFKALRILKLK